MDVKSQPGRSLRLLSLDGGGVRGLSSLIILRYLMKLINPQCPPKPCQYFDLICGTSTGGLIAIMLGRLRMDVDSCIKAYQKLADRVFTPKRVKFNLLGKGVDLWQLSGAFDAEKFAQAVKEIITDCGLPADARLIEDPDSRIEASGKQDPQCKIFVCAVRTEINKAVRLKSYMTDGSVEEVDCAIWEAARATSAATSFFSHIDIEGQRFTDGATECNNPIEHLLEEAEEIWPDVAKGCVLSLGTGRPKLEAFGKNLLEVGKTLVKLSTNAERTAETFQRSAHSRGLEDVYYRFNVSQGLENVGLESSDQQGQIWAATNHYLNDFAVKRQCKALTNSLKRIFSLHEQATYLQTLPTYDVVQELGQIATPLGTTFRWVIKSKEYKAWLDTSAGCLHIRGKPGCGKSVLMAYIRNCVNKHTAFFACKETDQSRRNPQLVLSTLLHQIIDKQPHLIQDALHVDQCDQDWTYEQLLTCLRSVLCSDFNKGVVCFVDGLDECDLLPRKRLLKDLRKIFDSQTHARVAPGVKLIIASRDYPDIHLTGDLIDLDSSPEMHQDLYDFIAHQVAELILSRPNYLPLSESIIEKLASRANGMYRLVELLIDQLDDLTDSTVNTLNSALEHVPSTIGGMYDSIWAKIPPHEQSRARSIISWLLCMQRPLSSVGLGRALAVECSSHAAVLSAHSLAVSVDLEGDIKRLLGPLIRLKPSIELSHQSVRDHFLRKSDAIDQKTPNMVDASQAHAQIAFICLRYLNSPDHRYNSRAHEAEDEFLNYALKFAPNHIALGCKNEHIFGEEVEIFFQQQVWSKSWEQVVKPDLDLMAVPWLPDCRDIISFTCRFNLPDLLTRQLTLTHSDQQSIKSRHHNIGHSCTWLYEALASHNEQCLMPILSSIYTTVFAPRALQSLFDSALDPLPDLIYNWPKSAKAEYPAAKGARMKESLRCAFQMTDLQDKLDAGFVVKSQKFSDLKEYSNTQDRILRAYWTLNESEAVTSGRVSNSTQASPMLQLALILCIFLKSPRLFFLYQRHAQAFSMIAVYGEAHLEEPLFSPTSQAVVRMAQHGNFGIVKALVQEGAGLSARDSNKASVLHWAARSGSPDFVQYVLERTSADINHKDARGMTPLHYACSSNHLWDNQIFADSRPECVSRNRVVQLLLAAGAQRQARDNHGNTPLQTLSRVYIPDWSDVPDNSDLRWRGDDLIECLELLIEGVSDIMRWDSYKTTILHYAAYFWPKSAVKHLVDYLAALSLPITLVDHKGFSPLHYAVVRPFDDSADIIELLSQAGVDVRAGQSQSMDALAIAKRYKRFKALEQLIAVKEAQIVARKKAFEGMLYETWVGMENRKQRNAGAMLQDFLHLQSMNHIPIGHTPLLGFLRFPHAIQPYLNHPSTEFCDSIMRITMSILKDQRMIASPQHLVAIPPTKIDVVLELEQAAGNVVLRLSELERHLDPFPGIRAVHIHRPLLSTNADPHGSEAATTDDLIALNRPDRVFSRKGSWNVHDDISAVDRYEEENALQEKLEHLNSRVEEGDKELEDAVKGMLQDYKGPRTDMSQYQPPDLSKLYRKIRPKWQWLRNLLYAIVFQHLQIFELIVFPLVILYTGVGVYPLGGCGDLRFINIGGFTERLFLPHSDVIHGVLFNWWVRNRMDELRDHQVQDDT